MLAQSRMFGIANDNKHVNTEIMFILPEFIFFKLLDNKLTRFYLNFKDIFAPIFDIKPIIIVSLQSVGDSLVHTEIISANNQSYWANNKLHFKNVYCIILTGDLLWFLESY